MKALIDVNYLAYRAVYSIRGLSYDEIPTTVAYGVFQTIAKVKHRFSIHSNDIMFAFDHPVLHRKELYPQYKGNRHTKPEEIKVKEMVGSQLKSLFSEYLPAMGFANVWKKKGYEADDLIAAAAFQLGEQEEKTVVVSGDEDLYQVLSPYCFIFQPRSDTTMTFKKFKEKYGIEPKQWITVKAIAGCSSDNIPGVPGVGETSAVKYLSNQPLADRFRIKIEQGLKDGEVKKWKSLVRLPFDSAIKEDLVIEESDVTPRKIKKVFTRLGINSIEWSD